MFRLQTVAREKEGGNLLESTNRYKETWPPALQNSLNANFGQLTDWLTDFFLGGEIRQFLFI